MTTPHGPPIQAIDDYFTLKDGVRVAAREPGYSVTFMPKPYAECAGCSLHTHISIRDADGEEDLTASTEDEIALSELGKWFMGGIPKHADALTGLGSPTANTYRGYGNRGVIILRFEMSGRRQGLGASAFHIPVLPRFRHCRRRLGHERSLKRPYL